MKEGRCTLVEIEQQISGFERFIGSWVYRGDMTFVVDVGPAHSVGGLIETLGKMGVVHVDYVLITHIHIDHAGGLARFLAHFPMAHVVCHKKGIAHLVDPAALWKGSQKALGDIAEAYGPPGAVEEERCIPHSEVSVKDLEVIDTPGHAPHHLSFSYQGHLFAGEAAGNYYAIQGTDYLRPATPPRFFLEVFLQSVARLMALDDQHLCYAHWGETGASHQALKRFRKQILRWQDIIEEEVSSEGDDPLERCVNRLLKEDADLKAFKLMAPDMQKRERYFLTNSVRGFIGFLRDGER